MALFCHVTFLDISVNFKCDMGLSFVIQPTEVNYKNLSCRNGIVTCLPCSHNIDLSVNVQSDTDEALPLSQLNVNWKITTKWLNDITLPSIVIILLHVTVNSQMVEMQSFIIHCSSAMYNSVNTIRPMTLEYCSRSFLSAIRIFAVAKIAGYCYVCVEKYFSLNISA